MFNAWFQDRRLLRKQNEEIYSMLPWFIGITLLRSYVWPSASRKGERERKTDSTLGQQEKIQRERGGKKPSKIQIVSHCVYPPNVSNAKSIIWAAKVKIRVTDSSTLLAFGSTICPLSSVQTHSWWCFGGKKKQNRDTVKSDSYRWLVRWKSVRAEVTWDENV